MLLGDSSKARKELGWEPKYDLQMLVKEMIATDWEEAKKAKFLLSEGYEVTESHEA